MPTMTFVLEDGTTFEIETNSGASNAAPFSPETRDLFDQHIPTSFEKSLDRMRKMAGTLLQSLRGGLFDQPDEVEVTFGLKASGEVGGLIVAKAEAEASYSVKLTWKREADASSQQVRRVFKKRNLRR